MIGAIVGDIVGSIYEFSNIKTKDFELFGDGCEITDDSIMTLATAKALYSCNESYEDFKDQCIRCYKEFGRTYPFPLGGYGVRFSTWIKSPSYIPYNSYGNGSAMRVSPVAYAAYNLEETMMMAKATASVTHNHPEGIKGAQATACAIKLALDRNSKEQIRDYISEHFYPEVDTLTADTIRPEYKFEASCQKTVPQAIVAFLDSDGFEDAIRTAVSIGGDSDTLTAITGSIAEAYYGVPKNIRNTAESYLPEHLLGVLHTFEKVYG